ncbi:hypothetical protein C1924_02135 [Stenotrophomonas sp. ESTM1D_MKCIP4_1]|uniref:hypothetical protein n=1 Tax=Stenotrophomonas sp. ESTM1D_MKCIP4_1 TaxID=2072414 RepID=UPI000D54099C|nr:hypothetical protein [Stenotrophomonas sp. ESTM1D_MKCIP4_1]AWH52071.1 hypothetical protein C1924_02135 [Stenotrophomonas sp. ESTM1D_MKCIP4_1]
MSSAPLHRYACVAMAAVLAATACTRAPFKGNDEDLNPVLKGRTTTRMVEGRTYTVEPVEASVGRHRFAFPANLYYNQIAALTGGVVVLTLMWPDFDAAPPGDYPLRTEEDGYRQVSVELRYLGHARTADYLAQHIGRGSAQSLAERVAMVPRLGLTPYAVDRSRGAGAGRELEPDWYVARAGDGRVMTFISCDPSEYMPDGLLMERWTLVRSNGDRIAMCRHSWVDVERGIAVEMHYARVMLVDWKRLEGAVGMAMQRYEVGR